jgi:hypothetical protein
MGCAQSKAGSVSPDTYTKFGPKKTVESTTPQKKLTPADAPVIQIEFFTQDGIQEVKSEPTSP